MARTRDYTPDGDRTSPTWEDTWGRYLYPALFGLVFPGIWLIIAGLLLGPSFYFRLIMLSALVAGVLVTCMLLWEYKPFQYPTTWMLGIVIPAIFFLIGLVSRGLAESSAPQEKVADKKSHVTLTQEKVHRGLFVNGARGHGWSPTDLNPRVKNYKLTYTVDPPWKYTGLYLGGLQGSTLVFYHSFSHEGGYNTYFKDTASSEPQLIHPGYSYPITGNKGALYISGNLYTSDLKEQDTTISIDLKLPSDRVVVPTWKEIPGGTAAVWGELAPRKHARTEVYVRFSESDGTPLPEHMFMVSPGKIVMGKEEFQVTTSEESVNSVTLDEDPGTLTIHAPDIGKDESGQPRKVFCQVNVVVFPP